MKHTEQDGLEAVVRGNTALALDLYQELRPAAGNLFFSPHSISAVLAVTYAGARGSTAQQMARALHFSDPDQMHPAFASLQSRLAAVADKGQVQLQVANALWPQQGYPLRDTFLALAERYYGVQVTPLDYAAAEAARRTINTWVKDKTEGKIEDLIPPGLLNELTRLILVNAIYFQGYWASRFDPRQTADAPFWVGPDIQVRVPMMGQVGTFRHGRGDGLQVLELPYEGADLAMVLLLPDQIDGLAELETRLTPQNLHRWTTNLHSGEISVSLPRFKIRFPFRLDGALRSLGMVDAFDNADFSGLDGTRQLYLSAVLHQAFIAVDEQGTEAAAATAAVVHTLSFVPTPVFRADHPFIFFIRENGTGSILFIGRVADPPPSDSPPGKTRAGLGRQIYDLMTRRT